MQPGEGFWEGVGDGLTMLHSVIESAAVAPSPVDRTSLSSLNGFTVFDLVSNAI